MFHHRKVGCVSGVQLELRRRLVKLHAHAGDRPAAARGGLAKQARFDRLRHRVEDDPAGPQRRLGDDQGRGIVQPDGGDVSDKIDRAVVGDRRDRAAVGCAKLIGESPATTPPSDCRA